MTPSPEQVGLRLEGLTVTDESGKSLLHQVELAIPDGEVVGLLGSSGSGKSVLARTLVGLWPIGTRPPAGRMTFRGRDLLALDPKGWAGLRGREIALVPSGARRLLNPVVRVGDQIAAVLRSHEPSISRRQARRRAVEELGKLAVNDPERRARAFPHELSGGMCQRVLIAMAFVCRPRLVICDDATSGLDVTVQALVLDDLRRRVREEGAGALLISHDVGVIAQVAARVAVLVQGRIVEQGPVDEVLVRPAHPETERLVEPARLGRPQEGVEAPG